MVGKRISQRAVAAEIDSGKPAGVVLVVFPQLPECEKVTPAVVEDTVQNDSDTVRYRASTTACYFF